MAAAFCCPASRIAASSADDRPEASEPAVFDGDVLHSSASGAVRGCPLRGVDGGMTAGGVGAASPLIFASIFLKSVAIDYRQKCFEYSEVTLGNIGTE